MKKLFLLSVLGGFSLFYANNGWAVGRASEMESRTSTMYGKTLKVISKPAPEQAYPVQDCNRKEILFAKHLDILTCTTVLEEQYKVQVWEKTVKEDTAQEFIAPKPTAQTTPASAQSNLIVNPNNIVLYNKGSGTQNTSTGSNHSASHGKRLKNCSNQ